MGYRKDESNANDALKRCTVVRNDAGCRESRGKHAEGGMCTSWSLLAELLQGSNRLSCGLMGPLLRAIDEVRGRLPSAGDEIKSDHA